VPTAWNIPKVNGVKKKTSIGNSPLSRGSGTNKKQKRKKYRGQGK
tara:strand:+ start:195 stop:329 length:135 start_codon:yes stop_codon:yes gene_type:complete